MFLVSKKVNDENNFSRNDDDVDKDFVLKEKEYKPKKFRMGVADLSIWEVEKIYNKSTWGDLKDTYQSSFNRWFMVHGGDENKQSLRYYVYEELFTFYIKGFKHRAGINYIKTGDVTSDWKLIKCDSKTEDQSLIDVVGDYVFLIIPVNQNCTTVFLKAKNFEFQESSTLMIPISRYEKDIIVMLKNTEKYAIIGPTSGEFYFYKKSFNSYD